MDMLVFWYEMVKGQEEHSWVDLVQFPSSSSGVGGGVERAGG